MLWCYSAFRQQTFNTLEAVQLHSATMVKFGLQSFYGKVAASSENSATLNDLSDMDNDLNVSRISLANNDNLIEDLVNEDANLSGIFYPDVFDRSLNVSFVSDAGFNSCKIKVTKGQMVKNKEKKCELNVESDIGRLT